LLTPPAALVDLGRTPAALETPPDDFQRSLDALTIIVGDNLHRPEQDLIDSPVLPMRLLDTTQPAPSSAEQAAAAMERFRNRARQYH
jgi:hypothetical protein